MTSLLEDQIKPPGRSSAPASTGILGEGNRLPAPPVTYRIAKPAEKVPVRVPGKRPEQVCHAVSGPFRCTRPLWHGGRCAAIWWRAGELYGAVRAVWGFRPDVSKAQKVSAEEIAGRVKASAS